MRAYWWRGKSNFGDQLTPLILQHFAGIRAEWAPPAEAEIVVVGSVLDVLPYGWSGIVAGAGKLKVSTSSQISGHILGVRGHLTLPTCVGPVYGDPALLVDELVHTSRDLDLGVVPHWTDKKLAPRFAHLNPTVIDPAEDPLTVINMIGRCKKIVSSSLHGVIVADAFGIPRRIEKFENMSKSYEGGTFKFEDYSSSIDMPLEFGKLDRPDRMKIFEVQAQLFDMFSTLRSMYGEAS